MVQRRRARAVHGLVPLLRTGSAAGSATLELETRASAVEHRLQAQEPAATGAGGAHPEQREGTASGGVGLGAHHAALVDEIYPIGVEMSVARRSTIPVLVYKHGDDADVNPFEHVLFPTGFSNVSSRALDFLKSLAGVVKEVDLVHVFTSRERGL